MLRPVVEGKWGGVAPHGPPTGPMEPNWPIERSAALVFVNKLQTRVLEHFIDIFLSISVCLTFLISFIQTDHCSTPTLSFPLSVSDMYISEVCSPCGLYLRSLVI